MQVVFDFITGKIGCAEFKEAWYADPNIGQWIENVVDLQSGPTPEWNAAPYPAYRMAIYKYYDGSFLKFVQASEESRKQRKGIPPWVNIGWYFDTIASIVTVAYPDIIPTKYYDEEKKFYQTAVGEYIGGEEVEAYIGALLENFPRAMGKTKRKTGAKAAIREAFHLKGSKYPRWAQEPEWPMGKKAPMEYIAQKRTGDLVRYTFKDVDTGEMRIIEQLY